MRHELLLFAPLYALLRAEGAVALDLSDVLGVLGRDEPADELSSLPTTTSKSAKCGARGLLITAKLNLGQVAAKDFASSR